MKILFVDSRLEGHHLTYLSALVEASAKAGNQVVGLLPYTEKKFNSNVKVYQSRYCGGQKFNYFKWMNEVKRIAKAEKIDIIHFLYGDEFYRYFGWGICRLPSKVIITCHQVRWSALRNFSYKLLGKSADAIVVHTENITRSFKALGVDNVIHIEYPQFGNSPLLTQQKALELLGVHNIKSKTLLALGGTRSDKGLDILLDALSEIESPFHLIIAGKEETFTRKYIEERTQAYKDKVTIFLEFLSDEKFALCLDAADIIVLPYKYQFDGASGPLGEGVWHYKQIVGSNHKSLGNLIETNHLGKTFECENVEALRDVLTDVLHTDWKPDETYKNYRNELNPKIFQEHYLKLFEDLYMG